MNRPLYLTESDVLALLPMEAAIQVVREAFVALAEGKAQNQPRRRLILPEGSVLHQMAAFWGKYFGAKIYSTNPRHGASFWFHLFDAETAQPLAIFEANWLGQIRTGAASAVATDLLAHSASDSMAIIGTGFQARSQLDAIAKVRSLKQVRVWSRSAEKRRQFAVEMSERTGLDVQVAETAEQAVRGMAIVTTATSAKDPVLDAAWVAPGAHVNAMGSNQARRRELPEELVRRASLIVVDSLEQSRIESGDLLLALAEAEWTGGKIVELAHALTTTGAARDPSGITIFKSNGLAVEDVAAASVVYEEALQRGLDREMRW